MTGGEMQLTFLGTGSAYPSPKRGASCCVLRLEDGSSWMFDCGEGSQIQVMKCKAVRPSSINKVFITHLHGDHVYGIIGMLCTISMNKARGDGSDPVEIYGPKGLRKFIRSSLNMSRSMLQFPYVVHEIQHHDLFKVEYMEDSWVVDLNSNDHPHPMEQTGRDILYDPESKSWNIFDDKSFIVKAGWLEHSIESYGYVISEKPQPGKMNVEFLVSKGIQPGPIYGKLKQGLSIQTQSGEKITPNDAILPDRPGRKIVILGDTKDSSKLVELAKDADILVHEATLENEMVENAISKSHSTPQMAAEFANSIDAKKLILTHFSQRYAPLNVELKDGEVSVEKLETQAKETFGSNVVAAEDFLSIDIPRKI